MDGVGIAGGGSFTFFTVIRVALQLEARIVHDPSQSLKSGWSGGMSLSRSASSMLKGGSYVNGLCAEIGLTFLGTNADNIDQLDGNSETKSGATIGYGPVLASYELNQMENDAGMDVKNKEGNSVKELSLGLPLPYTGVGFGMEYHEDTDYKTSFLTKFRNKNKNKKKKK